MFFSYICYTDPDPDGAFPGPEPLPMTRNKDIFTFRDAEKQTGPVAFSTMLKPAGSACNLDCHYCYYLDKAVQYGGRQAVMPDELLERYIRQYIEANDVPTVTFCWHGGEPLLLGIDFYRRALALQQKYADGKRIENTLQTNGTLIDEAWCDLFAANNFLVGLSLDGPEDLHDAFRRTKGGRPTFRRVMQTVEMFRARGVEYNTLSVVNRLSEGRGAEIYRFFRDTVRSRYMQFLPAVEHVVDVEGFHRPLIVSPEREGARLAEWSVTADGYGQFLCDVFDEWVVGDVGQVFVQMFDATLAQWCGVQPGVCSMGETCGDALVVEHNGDVYSCDHFVYPPFGGNLSFEEAPRLRPGEAQCPAGRVPALPLLLRLPGRVPEAPLRDRIGRLPQKYSLRRPVPLFPPRGTLYGVHARDALEGAVAGMGHPIRAQAHGSDVAAATAYRSTACTFALPSGLPVRSR